MENKQNNLTIVNQSEKFPLIISEKLEKKIRVLCNKFPNTEWSGQLFYSYEGSFKDGSIKFKAEDLLFMDTGDGTSTEFYLNEGNAASYITDHELWDCQIGLIHSHHSMQAFFSGQDNSMLLQEGSNRNHFLSLVVNNKGNYVARITVKEERDIVTTGTKQFHTFNDEIVNILIPEHTQKTTIVSTYDLDIINEFSFTCEDYDELMATIAECDERKKSRMKEPAVSTFNAFKPVDFPNFPVFNEPVSKPLTANKETNELSFYEVQQYVKQLLALNPIVNDSIENIVTKFLTEIPKRFSPEEYKYVITIYCDYFLDTEIANKFDEKCADPEIAYDAYLTAKETISKEIEKFVQKYPENVYLKILYNYIYD